MLNQQVAAGPEAVAAAELLIRQTSQTRAAGSEAAVEAVGAGAAIRSTLARVAAAAAADRAYYYYHAACRLA